MKSPIFYANHAKYIKYQATNQTLYEEDNSMKKKERDNRIKFPLRSKINLQIILFTIVLTASIITVGSFLYLNAVKNSYDRTAYDICEVTESFFTEQEIVEYANLIKAYEAGEPMISSYNHREVTVESIMDRSRYKEVKSYLASERENFGLNDIFVAVVDREELDKYTPEAKESGEWKPIKYIMDCYNVPEEDMRFGDKSSIVVDFIDEIREVIDTGKRVDVFMETNTKFGWNMNALYPIVSEGKTVAVINVELPMPTLSNDVFVFVISMSGLAVLILIIAIIALTTILGRGIISPIKLMANEANHFISAEARVSDKLSDIKTRDEIQMLSESLLTMELSINDYIRSITEITAEKERIGAELDIANGIQASMLPQDFDLYDSLKMFDLYATMTPAKEVGGDFYDFFMTDATHVALVIADVSGKGVPAALFMAKGKTAIKTRAMMGGNPGDILADVNEQMCEGNEAELFVTVWLAIIDLETGKGYAANAGHEHPGLRHKDGTFELIKYRHSPAVATMEGMMFRDHEFELQPGDTLFVYTDGVTEATDANNELFGEERLTEALDVNPDAAPKELLANVRAGIDKFVADAPQFDDITMLGFRYFGKAE